MVVIVVVIQGSLFHVNFAFLDGDGGEKRDSHAMIPKVSSMATTSYNADSINELYKALYDCMEFNSGKYKIHSQAVGLLYSKICRDPEDISKTFRESNAINKSMKGFATISIKEAAKYVSPFVSLTSENLDESIMSSILLTDEEKNGKKHTESPLEKVLMM